MVIWFAMTIPVITALVLYFLFKRRTLWWEFLIPVCVSFVLILICKFSIETLQTLDTEYWGGWMEKAEFYEEWNERVSCRHPIYDKKGNLTGYEHFYDVDNHPPYWQAFDSNSINISIDKAMFEEIARKFGNRQWVDLHRSYHTKDGDKYVAAWKGSDETLEPVVTVHNYENRIQASESIMNFPEVDKKNYGLFDYPGITEYYRCQSILGLNQAEADRRLNVWNAKLGSLKQVRIWILVFVDKPHEAGLEQQAYWKGGNKNEFVVTIGVNSQGEVQWCYPFSWTEAEQLKVDTRNFVINQKELDLVQVVDWLGPEIRQKFVRKLFSDFSYLAVEPPLWAVMLTFLITIGVNIGVSIWIVKNEFSETGNQDRR